MRRLACFSITECIKTALRAAVEALSNLPPLHIIFVGEKNLATVLRLNDVGEWRINGKQIGYAAIFEKKTNLCKEETLATNGAALRQILVLTPPFKTCTPKKRRKE